MMGASGWPPRIISPRPLLGAAAWAGVFMLTVDPAPLAPIARLVHALCAFLPPLAAVGQHLPPLSLALVLLLLGSTGVVGLSAGLREWRRSRRLTRQLLGVAQPLPARLAGASGQLGLAAQVAYLATPVPIALCYGLLRPRIMVSAGMLARLNDAELTAILLHERHHLQRRDPLRSLAMHAVTAGLFLMPLAPVWQRWFETRMELAADQAALSVMPRGALAGALAAVLTAAPARPAGLAALSATEARIASLVGTPQRAPLPVGVSVLNFGLLAGLAFALSWLANPHQVWEILCALCPGLAS